MTITLHFIAILACLVTIVFIFATKQYRFFVNRLVLYLMIISFFWSLTIMAETIPVTHDATLSQVKVRQGWESTCAAIGFITQVMESAKILMVCWIVLYLLLLVVFKYNASTSNHEAMGLVSISVLPLVVDWLPYKWNRYGLSGLWCWIRLTDDYCHNIWAGVGLMLAVEYVPVLLAIIFTFVSFLIIVVALCRRAYRTEIRWKWMFVYKKGLEEATALMVYPCVYAIIFMFRVIHRIFYIVQVTNSTPPTYTLWLAHSGAMGIGGILIPLFYILRPSNLRKFYICRKFFLSKDMTSAGVYRSNSALSTDAFSDGEPFLDSGQSVNESSLVYKSILSSSAQK